MVRRSEALLGTVVIAVSAAVNVAHTASHAGQHVMSLPAWQLAYVAVVIYAAPAVAAILLWTRFSLSGAWLLAVSMSASLAFGILYHYLIPGTDNVFTQPLGIWGTAFGVTALLLALVQAVGTAVGLWVALRQRRSRVGREDFLRRDHSPATPPGFGPAMTEAAEHHPEELGHVPSLDSSEPKEDFQ